MKLEIDKNWLKQHPLTKADLEQEVKLLGAVGIDFDFT